MAKIKTWAWWITHPKANWDHMFGDLKWQKNRVVAAYQRARYGWAKLDIHCGWDATVMKALGEQLVYFSDHTIAWPATGEYLEFEDWANALRTNGQALIDGGSEVPLPDVVDKWYGENSFLTEETEDGYHRITFPEKPDYIQTALDAHRDEEVRRYEAAKEALHWVADNHASLWD